MSSDQQHTTKELIFGAWRSRALYAGVKLGMIEALKLGAKTAPAIADELDLDPELGYRLLRAMASLGLLTERPGRVFELTEEGRTLLADHPQSLRAIALLQAGPEHYAAWKHLPALVRDGRQDAFLREFGQTAFEHADSDAEYGAVFDAAMNSYSALQTQAVEEALRGYDFSGIQTICDIGGGQGQFLCGILDLAPHLSGVVLERPRVLANPEQLWAARHGMAERCRYLAGDMFEQVPAADLYLLKLILHDWSDPEAQRILSVARKAARPGGRILLIEHVVPGPETPHFAKLYDIHMMCWGTGRERTAPEYARLLEAAGWRYTGIHLLADGMMSILEGHSA